MISIVRRAESMNVARIIHAYVTSSGTNAKYTASIQQIMPRRKHPKQKEGRTEKVEINLNSNRFAPECEDEQRLEKRKPQRVHPKKDFEPRLHQHIEFVASNNPPSQDIVEKIGKITQTTMPEAKAARISCTTTVASEPRGPFGPREIGLRRSGLHNRHSTLQDFVDKGHAIKDFSRKGSEISLIPPKRICIASSRTSESSMGAIARLLSSERISRPASRGSS